MASDTIDNRLQEWAAWFNTGGCAQGAWPRKNILHPSWMPPSGTGTPSMAVSTRKTAREQAMHAAIGQLSDKLIVCIVLRYARRMTAAEQARELACSIATIDGRHKRARDQLGAMLLMASP